MRDNYFNDLDNYLDYVKRRQYLWQVFLNVCAFFIVIWATYAFINLPVLGVRTRYAFVRDNIIANSSIKLSPASQDASAGNSAKQDDSSSYSAVENAPSDIPTNGIYIEKIDVKAPIILNATSENVQQTLEEGVAHIIGSSTPGTPGNIFLTGHSSDVWWTPGGYKTVFALLDKLENDDQIVLKYDDNLFAYKVYNKEVVDKNNVGRFVQTDRPQTVTIMTCFPIGTNWQRLMVQAERI